MLPASNLLTHFVMKLYGRLRHIISFLNNSKRYRKTKRMNNQHQLGSRFFGLAYSLANPIPMSGPTVSLNFPWQTFRLESERELPYTMYCPWPKACWSLRESCKHTYWYCPNMCFWVTHQDFSNCLMFYVLTSFIIVVKELIIMSINSILSL